MISLIEYGQYWERVKERMPELKSVFGFTADVEMSKKIQALRKAVDLPALVWVVPSMPGLNAPNIDNIREPNACTVFLMDKYDPQRDGGSLKVLSDLQPLMERIKDLLIDDYAYGCRALHDLELPSISILPETEIYKTFAGWSIGFTINT